VMFVQELARTPEESMAFTLSAKRATPRSSTELTAATRACDCAAYDRMRAARPLRPPPTRIAPRRVSAAAAAAAREVGDARGLGGLHAMWHSV
jgi:hypothetical protein